MNRLITLLLTPEIVAAVLPTVAIFVTWILNRRAIQQIHLTMNSRLDLLIKAVGDAARLEGHHAGEAEERERRSRQADS